ncbi:PorT family protein [Chryseobacterium sp. L7]|uniref:PorT family protein n=1 Tax=Chryseobacterium endalhagicum TaxID=2797638 RepID=A0ABS1QFJ9_9FLAO|nr:porin family protein [Chryseobacterium endalhagicum]MBL1221117.1 PorT family protein [Chryseobacterium endalhagicum]
MKKLFLGLAVSVGSLALAQEKKETQSKSPISFGVKGGMNVSSHTDGNEDTYYWSKYERSAKIGFNAGVFANIPISGKFSVQPEVLYNGLGSKIESTMNFDIPLARMDIKETLSLSYLSVPVMLQYNLMPDLYVEAGPEFGYLLGGRYKNESTQTSSIDGSSSTQSQSGKIAMYMFNKFNFGIGIGAGYYFTQNLAVTARFTGGITNIYKHNTGDAVRNNALQVGLAYKFK